MFLVEELRKCLHNLLASKLQKKEITRDVLALTDGVTVALPQEISIVSLQIQALYGTCFCASWFDTLW